MFKSHIKGELTIVISEKKIKNKSFNENEIKIKKRELLKKYTLKDVVELLHKTENGNKKKIYQINLSLKK